MFKYCISLLFISFFLQANAQQKDTIVASTKVAVTDTAKTNTSFKTKFKNTTKEIGLLFKDTTVLQNPRKAVLRSAVIPGWGQARNKKWWKVPLVYGGFVGLGLVYEFNNRFYKELLAESQFRKANPTTDERQRFLYSQYQGLFDEQIFSGKDFYRRNRDLTLYSSFGFYLLQMVDAYIDAKLATFDVSDDLSLKIKPTINMPSYASTHTLAPMPMLTLKLNFK